MDRIRSRVRVRRRARITRRIILGLASIGVVAGIVVPLATDHAGRGAHQVLSVIPPADSATTAPGKSVAASEAPSDQLVTVGNSDIRVLSAATGAVLRTTALAPQLPGPPGAQLAVDPTARTAYVSVAIDTSCPSSVVFAIDLHSGQDHVIATSAAAPTISRDGIRLAYMSCSGQVVTVETLSSGARQSWQIVASSTPQPSQQLSSLQWAPDGHHLIMGRALGPSSGIEDLDTALPVSSANPTIIGSVTNNQHNQTRRYSDPVFRPDGTIVAILPFCVQATSCGGGATDEGDGVVTVEATDGQIADTLLSPKADPGFQLFGLAVDPSGQRLAVRADGTDNLYQILAGRLRLITQQGGAVGWLPHSADQNVPKD